MERNHLGRLIDSEHSPIIVPKRPIKRVRQIPSSKNTLLIRQNDKVFQERYGSCNLSTLSQRKLDVPIKNRNFFLDKNMTELFLLDYNSKEWNPSQYETEVLLQGESFAPETLGTSQIISAIGDASVVSFNEGTFTTTAALPTGLHTNESGISFVTQAPFQLAYKSLPPERNDQEDSSTFNKNRGLIPSLKSLRLGKGPRLHDQSDL